MQFIIDLWLPIVAATVAPLLIEPATAGEAPSTSPTSPTTAAFFSITLSPSLQFPEPTSARLAIPTTRPRRLPSICALPRAPDRALDPTSKQRPALHRRRTNVDPSRRNRSGARTRPLA